MSFLRSVVLALSLAPLVACVEDAESGDTGVRWRLPLSGLDGALLSVAGTAPDDVWMVGSDPGAGPAILHWDGAEIRRVAAEVRGDLWWVTSDGARVWACGAGGLVLHRGAGSEAWERVESGTELTLYGIVSFAPDDTWAVGGDPAAKSGVILRHDGTAFTEIDAPDEAEGATWFKVWGAAPDDVWIVGLGGTALHWDGTVFTAIATPAGRPLLTVHGAGTDVVAVGGFGNGFVVHAQAGALLDATPPDAPQLSGVHVTPEGDAVAVGTLGSVWRRSGGTWTPVEDTPVISQDYHAVYVDPGGGIWAVGGDIVAPPFRSGMLAHFGEPLVVFDD